MALTGWSLPPVSEVPPLSSALDMVHASSVTSSMWVRRYDLSVTNMTPAIMLAYSHADCATA